MSGNLEPPDPSFRPNTPDHDDLRLLSRSPHPYHHQNADLPHPAERLLRRRPSASPSASRAGAGALARARETTTTAASVAAAGLAPDAYDDEDDESSSRSRDGPRRTSFPSFSKDSSPASDSGTDADDEHFLKGLPAPRTRLHKGLRGGSEPLSGTSTPMLSPAILEEEGRNAADSRKEKARYGGGGDGGDGPAVRPCWYSLDIFRRRKVLVRRAFEAAIVASMWLMLWQNRQVRPLITAWSRGRSRTRPGGRLVSVLFACLQSS